jgi:cytochrome c5
MKRLFPLIAGWVAITAAGSAQGVAPRQQPAAAAPAAVAAHDVPPRAMFDKYCVTCHNQKLKTGGLTLDTMDPANVAEGAATWEKVVRRLRGGSMPPAGMPRPDQTVYDSVAGWLETELDRAAAVRRTRQIPAFSGSRELNTRTRSATYGARRSAQGNGHPLHPGG